jgi:uncharacterized protein (DUF2236 family)
MSRGDGYFPRGRSVLRMVHGERAVGRLYGQRSLLLQATHPLAFTGLNANTQGYSAPFRRLVHTAKTMEVVFFGSREDAERETARVRELHSRVRGEIDRPAGRWPAGSAYAADAPELLLWILACLADSAEATYERLVRPLSPPLREGFWQDYLLVGELFGLPREHAPATHAEYRAYISERLASDDLYVLPEAREIARQVAFELPLPATRRWALPAINLLVVGLLPQRVRALYRLRWSPAHEAAFSALAAGSRAARPVLPRPLVRGRTAPEYDLVARSEAKRLNNSAISSARARSH